MTATMRAFGAASGFPEPHSGALPASTCGGRRGPIGFRSARPTSSSGRSTSWRRPPRRRDPRRLRPHHLYVTAGVSGRQGSAQLLLRAAAPGRGGQGRSCAPPRRPRGGHLRRDEGSSPPPPGRGRARPRRRRRRRSASRATRGGAPRFAPQGPQPQSVRLTIHAVGGGRSARAPLRGWRVRVVARRGQRRDLRGVVGRQRLLGVVLGPNRPNPMSLHPNLGLKASA